jgi:hypothetical protein
VKSREAWKLYSSVIITYFERYKFRLRNWLLFHRRLNTFEAAFIRGTRAVDNTIIRTSVEKNLRAKGGQQIGVLWILRKQLILFTGKPCGSKLQIKG